MRARAGWTLAVAVGLATAVTPRPPAPSAPSPVVAVVQAAGYGAAQLSPTVRVPAVADLERRTAQTPRWSVDWSALGDCETGEWVNGGESFVPGTVRWDASDGYHEGGTQFAPPTWDAFRDPWMPDAAYDASPYEQMVVNERVLAVQGLVAWPRCTVLLGWR